VRSGGGGGGEGEKEIPKTTRKAKLHCQKGTTSPRAMGGNYTQKNKALWKTARSNLKETPRNQVKKRRGGQSKGGVGLMDLEKDTLDGPKTKIQKKKKKKRKSRGVISKCENKR